MQSFLKSFSFCRIITLLTKLCPLMISAYSGIMVSSKTESLEYKSFFLTSWPLVNLSLLGPIILSLAFLSMEQQQKSEKYISQDVDHPRQIKDYKVLIEEYKLWY